MEGCVYSKHDPELRSWVRDEQRPCIIQSDIVLRCIGQGNWSQSILQGRATPMRDRGQSPSLQISTSHDSSSFTTKLQFVWQGQSLNLSLQPIWLLSGRPVTTPAPKIWCRWPALHASHAHLLSLQPLETWWENNSSINKGWQLLLSWPSLMFI